MSTLFKSRIMLTCSILCLYENTAEKYCIQIFAKNVEILHPLNIFSVWILAIQKKYYLSHIKVSIVQRVSGSYLQFVLCNSCKLRWPKKTYIGVHKRKCTPITYFIQKQEHFQNIPIEFLVIRSRRLMH